MSPRDRRIAETTNTIMRIVIYSSFRFGFVPQSFVLLLHLKIIFVVSLRILELGIVK